MRFCLKGLVLPYPSRRDLLQNILQPHLPFAQLDLGGSGQEIQVLVERIKENVWTHEKAIYILWPESGRKTKGICLASE